MTRSSSTVKKDITGLSQQRTEALKLLLEARSRQAQRIAPCVRNATGATATFPASAAQQRLWFVDQLEGGSTTYRTSLSLRLRGALDIRALQAAMDAVVRRHEVLRTVFESVDGQPLQAIASEGRCELRVIDLTEFPATQRQSLLQAQKVDEAEQKFDLSRGPLSRGRLIRLATDEFVLLVTLHHIISDGWSMGILAREIAEFYTAAVEERSPEVSDLPIQYADYSQWQRQRLHSKGLQAQLSYWRERLQGSEPQLDLPTDRPRSVMQSYRGSNVEFVLDTKLTKQLLAFAQRREMTSFMILYAAWSLLLYRFSGQGDLLIGTPVANRQRPEVEGLIGCFVNTLVLRLQLRPDASVEHLLTQAREAAIGAFDHQEVPFEQLVEMLQPERVLGRHPLFQVMFSLQNAPRAELLLSSVSATPEEEVYEAAMFDLLLHMEQRDGQLLGRLNYATDLFDRTTMQRWLESFTTLLGEMLARPDSRISDLTILPEDQRSQVLHQFNQTQAIYPGGKQIHELFEEQVRRTPHAVAVTGVGRYLTYAQLNNRANQLARYLVDRGVDADCFVGLCVARGVDMVLGMLAILKAGGAYVPLDPSCPADRLQHMLDDTAPKVVITQESLAHRVPQSVPTLVLDVQWPEIATRPTTNLKRSNAGKRDDRLAYVIYTSGSTGRPKGVAIEHRHAVNLIHWAQTTLPAEMFDRTLQSTSLNFDLSVYECFVPLSSGGSIAVVDNALALINEASDVTLINTVPSAIKGLLDASAVPKSTRVVNLAGEALPRETVERLFADSAVQYVCNLYGPSETTTYSSWILMSRETGFIPTIGRPIANTSFYILDDRRQPVPVGINGEIYIGGAGVARGYLNRPELTAERFLVDPFNIEPDARMYKTGDLGRWRPDGSIEYLGRNDHQVKIRGFRIELGEIEAQLRLHAQVREAVVIAREDTVGDKRLVAYVVPAEQSAPPSNEDLAMHLSAALPDYMVPRAWLMLERLPLTANGKLDRSSLPSPERASAEEERDETPMSESEQSLATIWRELLGLDRVGRRDNFFELGGHSLHGARMVAEVSRRFTITLPVFSIFQYPTIQQMARYVDSLRPVAPSDRPTMDAEEGAI